MVDFLHEFLNVFVLVVVDVVQVVVVVVIDVGVRRSLFFLIIEKDRKVTDLPNHNNKLKKGSTFSIPQQNKKLHIFQASKTTGQPASGPFCMAIYSVLS